MKLNFTDMVLNFLIYTVEYVFVNNQNQEYLILAGCKESAIGFFISIVKIVVRFLFCCLKIS